MKAIEKQSSTEVITHDVTPLTVNTDDGAYRKLGWWVVLAGVCGFLVWASLAPLDKGVPMTGTVATEGNRRAVQHQFGGTVDDILVKDGDHVKAGQVVVRMNAITARSAAEMTHSQLIAVRANEARLQAERDGKSSVAVPASLQEEKDVARVRESLALQNQLMSSRQSALRNEIAAVDENIGGLRVQVTGLEESRDSKKVQLGIIKEQLENLRELARDGYIPRSRLLDMERTYAQLSGAISEDIGNIGRARRQIMELSLRRAQRLEEYQRDLRAQLTDAQKEAESLESRAKAQDFEVAAAEVKAPVSGTVVGLSVFTRGGVVGQGFRMMDIVAQDEALVVEAQLAVNLVDKVHKGLPVELMFSAFNTARTPHIPGEVIQVSADRTVDERNGAPYYKVRVRVTPEGAGIIAAKKLAIQPGMPVDLFVKTGERTMMSYLFKPVFDRAKSAMAED